MKEPPVPSPTIDLTLTTGTESSDDEEMSDSPPPGHNTKQDEKKRQAQIAEIANARRIHEASQPGRIPDGLGVTLQDSKYERDNHLWGTLGEGFYRSHLSNIVYVGRTAHLASEHEFSHKDTYRGILTRRLYGILPRGFPMNPHSVIRASRFIQDSKESEIDQVDCYRLIDAGV
jgi:hypothetical protein